MIFYKMIPKLLRNKKVANNLGLLLTLRLMLCEESHFNQLRQIATVLPQKHVIVQIRFS